MKSKVPFGIIAVLLLASIACGISAGATQTPTPAAAEPTGSSPTDAGAAPSPPAAGGSEVIVSVTMAKDVEGDQNDPVNPTDVFAPGDKTIHAVVAIQDAPPDTQFSAAWYTVDVGQAAAPNTLIDKTEIVTDGTRNIDFSLTTEESWPAGTYRIDFSVNDEVVETAEFSVQEP